MTHRAILLTTLWLGGANGGSAGEDASIDGNRGAARAADLDCGAPSFCAPRRCAPSESGADGRGCVDDPTPCGAGEACDEAGAACRRASACGEALPGCAAPGDCDGDGAPALECGGGDCDDADPARFPGNRGVRRRGPG